MQCIKKLSFEQLYWNLPLESLAFNTTKDVKLTQQVFGQQTAKQALTFAIENSAKGLNAYVRGLSGSGRKTLVRHLFSELKPKARQQKDYCYVHNFSQTNNPRLIILEKGYGCLFKQMMCSFADYVANDLPKTLNSEQIRLDRKKVESLTNKEVLKLYAPFEKKLSKHQLALANIKEGKNTQTVIVPVYEGKSLSAEAFEALQSSGKLSSDFVENLQAVLPDLEKELLNISQQTNEIIENGFAEIQKIDNEFAHKNLSLHLNSISKKFVNKELDDYLDEIILDFIQNRLHGDHENFNPRVLYGVNIISPKSTDNLAPIIFESSPNLTNLLGPVETDMQLPAYMSVGSGSLLKADGGYLILEVDDTLSENGAWEVLMRFARTSKLEIAFEGKQKGLPAVIKPDSIPLDVRIILIGSAERYYQLNSLGAGFSDYFKVLVDLEQDIKKNDGGYAQYASVIRKVIDKENLLHFDKSAVAQLIEHGVRISGSNEKLSARFGRIMDLVRESSYWAKKESADYVENTHVIQAIIAHKNRNYLPVKKFYQLLERGTIIVDTKNSVVGQINGLAVSQTINISYGFPARITATVSPGEAGLINIEGQANLSGQIHTKGFQILGGLLRYLIKPNHPLSFSASIAFEQSYGGIDGDSASGAEACCLISALTNIPISQAFSMTGAIDQFGHLQAIGGVNEKIEGFFDVCRARGLSGEQGVIIPDANKRELMLKPDIVEACRQGQFSIYAVDHLLDAFAILAQTESCKDAFMKQQIQENSLIDQLKKATFLLYQQSKGL